MANVGKARVLSPDEFRRVLDTIETQRHPARNALIMQLSFKLGLRVQELSLLRIREVAQIGPQYPLGYDVKDLLVLPKGFTKGARAMTKATADEAKRTGVRFSIAEFDRLLERIQSDVLAGKPMNAADYYPAQKKAGGKTRELPIVDRDLINAIKRYLNERLDKNEVLKPNAPLILSQKGGAFSPNTLQDHMRTMMRDWSGFDRASSHSGRRSLATDLLHNKGESLKTTQDILGHKNASTTVIYQDVPESHLRKVLKETGESYQKEEL